MTDQTSPYTSTHSGPATIWQRVENAALAVGVLVAMIVLDHPWWVLLVAFLLFDLSALGYLISQRLGAGLYNVVHNYTGPAAVLMLWAGLQLGHVHADWLVLLAACWAFHVAVDRALGYGLKLGAFRHTHLGVIGRDAAA